MTVDASTLSAVALLVFAASLSSYILYQWCQRRGAALLALGSSLLLTTVVIVAVVLSTKTPRIHQESIEATRIAIGVFPSTDRGQTEVAPATLEGSVASTVTHRSPRSTSIRERSDSEATSRTSPPSVKLRASPANKNATDTASNAHLTLTPWAATQCVHLLQPDPDEPTRWWLENDCNAPVAILSATCNRSAAQCNDLQSTSWRYPLSTMTLPSKTARSVTFEEQTLYGNSIRYIACVITEPTAVTRANAAATSVGDQSIETDDCLAKVTSASIRGERTGMSIDALFGRSAPGVVRTSDQ